MTAQDLLTTAASKRDTILFDGECNLCQSGARTLGKLIPRSRIELLSFRQPGVLERFPGITLERCERRMQLIRSDGRVFEGAEAIVQALRHRVLGRLAFAYYVPGLRQLADVLYSLVARYRFKLAGRSCESGACAIHYSKHLKRG